MSPSEPGASATAQSARDTLVQVTIERLTPVFESPSLAANTLVMAPAGQIVLQKLEVQNGFIRVPLQSIKASAPAIDGWITGLAGSGKSTLAVALAARTGLPIIHLDLSFWKPGWVAPLETEWREKQRASRVTSDR